MECFISQEARIEFIRTNKCVYSMHYLIKSFTDRVFGNLLIDNLPPTIFSCLNSEAKEKTLNNMSEQSVHKNKINGYSGSTLQIMCIYKSQLVKIFCIFSQIKPLPTRLKSILWFEIINALENYMKILTNFINIQLFRANDWNLFNNPSGSLAFPQTVS